MNFAVIGEAWTMVIKNAFPFVLAVTLLFLAYALVYGLGFVAVFPAFFAAVGDDEDFANALRAQLALQGSFFPFVVLAYGVAGPFALSISHMALKAVSGQGVDATDAVYGVSKFGPAFALGALIGLGVTVGSACCYLPAFMWGGMTMLAFPLMLTKNLGVVDAIKESWAAMKPHFWMATLLYLVISILAPLGVCVACVGMFLTVPLLYVVPALVYRDLFSIPTADPAPAATAPFSP